MEIKNMRTLPENISLRTNIFRQHSLPLSAPSACSVRSSEASERVRNVSSAGFSLVEISLSLLIIGIGMLSILGMFPAGLDQNARSIHDTHSALFAREVFSSLRVQAETNWTGIGNTTTNFSIAGSGNWNPMADTKLDNAVHTNVYRHPENTNIIDHSFRYRLALATNGLIKSATLRTWPGQFGLTNDPTLFYAEFFRLNR